MKKGICLLVLLVLLTACGQREAEIVLPEPEEAVCGAPLAETPAEEPDETVQVEFTRGDNLIVAQLPTDWEWETAEITEDTYAAGISFRPGTETAGWLRLQHWPDGFGVCGTGLKEEAVTFSNGLTGLAGYYDGSSSWSFIGFCPDYPDHALTVDGANWIKAYEEQIFQILGTVRFQKSKELLQNVCFATVPGKK